MKRFLLILSVLCLGVWSLQAQEKKYFSPEKGKWAIGVTFNPASIGGAIAMQPQNGEFAGEFLEGLAVPGALLHVSQNVLVGVGIQEPIFVYSHHSFLSSKWVYFRAMAWRGVVGGGHFSFFPKYGQS